MFTQDTALHVVKLGSSNQKGGNYYEKQDSWFAKGDKKMKDENWVKLNTKYDVWGYTDSRGIIAYDVLLKLVEQDELLKSLELTLEDSIEQLEKEFAVASPKSVSWYSLKSQLNTRKLILRTLRRKVIE